MVNEKCLYAVTDGDNEETFGVAESFGEAASRVMEACDPPDGWQPDIIRLVCKANRLIV